MPFWDGWTKPKGPEQQWYGGSEEANERLQKRDEERMGAAREEVGAEGNRLTGVAGKGSDRLSGVGNQAIEAGKGFAADSKNSQRDYRSAMGQYNAGRDAIFDNASALEKSAAELPSKYQGTADLAFKQNANFATRSAVGAASAGRGGALAKRNALAAASSANAQAQGQAAITRAQETNAMIGMQAQMRGQAAAIRGDVGARDISAGGIGANLAAQQAALQNSTYGTAANAYAQGTSAEVEASKARLGVAANQEQAYLGAEGNRNIAQLTAAREHELAEAQGRRSTLGSIFDVGGLVWK